MRFLLFFLIAMKKYFLFLLLVPLFVGFSFAHDCSTSSMNALYDAIMKRMDDVEYQIKLLDARSKYVVDIYEWNYLMAQYDVLNAEWEEVQSDVDYYEAEETRCQNKKDSITRYLKAWDSAFSELQKAESYKDFNIKTINKAIQNYQDAYDTMREANWLWDKSLESQLKERISKLKEFKSLVEITDEVINLSDKADNYFNKWDYDKALKYYKEALTYRSKIDDESMFISIELKITNINSIKAQEKQQEEAQKQQAEDDFTKAKQYFDNQGKTAILDSIIVAVKKKETRIQNNVYKAAEAFTKSSDTYTKNIGIYLVHERDK